MRQKLLSVLFVACMLSTAVSALAVAPSYTPATAPLYTPATSHAPATLTSFADDAKDETPDGFVLSAAFPNPFNPRTSFSLTTEERQDVTVEIFNVLGIAVERIFEGTMEANETRTFTFEADDLPSGIYLYRVRGESFTATRQMTLLK